MGPLKLDFIVLAQPRSGTHMLAFALDSHPDINMRGEVQFNAYVDKWSGSGKIKGGICPSYGLNFAEANKAIVLTRDHILRRDSGRINIRNQVLHYFEPCSLVAETQPVYDNVCDIENQKTLLEAADSFNDKIILSYEDITKEMDGLSLSNHHSKLICDFLGVPVRRLVTKTYKAEIKNNAHQN